MVFRQLEQLPEQAVTIPIEVVLYVLLNQLVTATQPNLFRNLDSLMVDCYRRR